MWLAMVKDELGEDLQINWRSFALEQVNSTQGDNWKAGEQGPDYVSRGLWSLRGGIAARQQGSGIHNEYMAVYCMPSTLKERIYVLVTQ